MNLYKNVKRRACLSFVDVYEEADTINSSCATRRILINMLKTKKKNKKIEHTLYPNCGEKRTV